MRKERPSHRGLRPGVLAFVAAAACAALAACSGRAGTTVPGATWYQLQAGTFISVAGPREAEKVPPKPWTVQGRVADFAFLGDSLYGAINGTGLASISVDAAGMPAFAYFPDALIFGHRTITTMVPRDGSIAVHLYYNILLNDAQPQDLQLSGISLVAFLPGQSNYTFLVPPFQRRNTDWEATGFAAESENSFDIEWKHTDVVETRFAYTRFHADTRAEETVTRDTFLAALGTPAISGTSVPGDLAAFFEECRRRIPGMAADTALQFFLRSKESPVRRSYRSQPQSDSAVTVPVFEQGASRWALMPDGSVLSSANGSPATIRLPALPEGFRYTDIVSVGAALVVPWEETSFTDVGRAGLLILKQP
jgi:hypothetical protein